MSWRTMFSARLASDPSTLSASSTRQGMAALLPMRFCLASSLRAANRRAPAITSKRPACASLPGLARTTKGLQQPMGRDRCGQGLDARPGSGAPDVGRGGGELGQADAGRGDGVDGGVGGGVGGHDGFPSRCEAAPCWARCFPGPRERWGWRGRRGFAGTRLHGAEALGRRWRKLGGSALRGREGAKPLGPPLRRVGGGYACVSDESPSGPRRRLPAGSGRSPPARPYGRR